MRSYAYNGAASGMHKMKTNVNKPDELSFLFKSKLRQHLIVVSISKFF